MKRQLQILKRAKKVKLLAMDVDGVLTAGEIIILNSGEELKVWSVKDRLGFALLKRSELPLKLAWITARQSRQVKLRAQDLKIDHLVQGCKDKLQALEQCARKFKVQMDEVAYIGDDLVDYRCLKKVGLSACPPESPAELKQVCHYRAQTPAGRGTVREIIELILKAQGAWKKATARFFLSLFLCSGLWGCYAPPKSPQLAERPDEWLEHYTIKHHVSGVLAWVLNSDNAQVFNKRNKAILENLNIEFMNPLEKKKQTRQTLVLAKKNLKQVAHLSAKNGEVSLDSKDLVVWDEVRIQSFDGTKLFTDRLRYSTARQKILTESPVKIVRGNSILIGEGMEASPDLSTVRIFRHQASVYPKEVPLSLK